MRDFDWQMHYFRAFAILMIVATHYCGVFGFSALDQYLFGMNMNNVAVTDGDRVEFEQRMGYHVDYYPVSSLME